MKLLSYKDIYETYNVGDVFYDKDLKRYHVLSCYYEHEDKVIIFTDTSGQETVIHNLTFGSRLLLVIGINKIKISIHWDKPLFFNKEQAEILKSINMDNIIDEYDKFLKDGLDKGIITEEEYKNPQLLKI